MAVLTTEKSKDYLAHFSREISEDIEDYVTNVVLLASRYLFIYKNEKNWDGYCTHCGNEIQLEEKLKHNSKTTCPICSSKCTVKESHRGRKTLVNEAYFVYYEKSKIDKNVIVARGIEAWRSYRGDYRNVSTEYRTSVYYIFDPKIEKGIMFSYEAWRRAYTESQTVYSLFSTYNNRKMMFIGTAWLSIGAAVKDTPFSWSGWELFTYPDMVKFLDLYCKYPQIEYLIKLGLKHLVVEKLNGGRTFSAINWKGKNLFSVLKISKQDLKEIKEKDIHLSYLFLYLLQRTKKLGWNCSLEDIRELENIAPYHRGDIKELEAIFEGMPVKKTLAYLKKQREQFKKHFKYNGSSYQVWKDYIRDCKTLEMDLTKENVIFPKNLYRAHQNTIKQIEYKENQELNLKIEKRLKKLSEKYSFESGGLIIRPAADTKELIEEGKALHHCVGGYAKRYAKGETIILVVRKAEEVDKPYYTVEINNDKIYQVRGKNNKAPTEDVEKFIEAFKEAKLSKKSKKKAEALPVSA